MLTNYHDALCMQDNQTENALLFPGLSHIDTRVTQLNFFDAGENLMN